MKRSPIIDLARALHGTTVGPAPAAVAELLDRAAELVGRGWNQGKLYGWAGSVVGVRDSGHVTRSALGALYDAAGVLPGLSPSPLVNAAEYAIADAVGVERGRVERWNDEPGRTKEQVIEAMRAAAAAQRKAA